MAHEMPDTEVPKWLPECWHRKWKREEDEGTQEKWESCELMRDLCQARKELAETRDQLDQERLHRDATRYEDCLRWRDVEVPCERCEGRGIATYGSTAAWMGGIGGAMITSGVCDSCWGTGDMHRIGANLRDLMDLRKELAETRDRADVLGMEIVILKAERDALKAADDGNGCPWKPMFYAELAKREAAEHQFQVARARAWEFHDRPSTCPHCMAQMPCTKDAVTGHLAVCPQHPMRKVEAERDAAMLRADAEVASGAVWHQAHMDRVAELMACLTQRDALQAKIAEDCRGCTDVADLTARLAEAVDCLGEVLAHAVSDRDYVRDIVPPDMQKRADAVVNL